MTNEARQNLYRLQYKIKMINNKIRMNIQIRIINRYQK